jgi:hypothetical protein
MVLLERAQDAGNADAGAEIGAAGDDRLHGFARTLGADILEHQVVLFEDAGVLTERRRLVFPVVDLTDRDLELILGRRRCGGQGERCEQRNGCQGGGARIHRVLPFWLFLFFG